MYRLTARLAAVLLLLFPGLIQAQTNMTLHPQVAEQILLGNYNPATYAANTVIDDRESIVQGIVDQVNADSLKNYLIGLESFHTRNTGSDTVSNTRGIGAARRWIHTRLQEFNNATGNRMVVGYLDYDLMSCGMDHHRNVFAMLPGADLSTDDFVLVEAHMDSRCETACDTGCYAGGMEDNGSGTVLVMELARVMSQYTFDRTIVFTLTTGEEQGLQGANAWAGYMKNLDLPFLACLNNDVIGGVYCGETSSPPSCPIPNEIDSTNVRIFSFSPLNDTNFVSPHKQLARYVTLQQYEEVNPRINTPMNINMQIREDRQGRGGDHIPFREKGYTALRFTSQNEHGDGTGSFPDRQHSTRDILGVDTDGDNELDSFFVDFNYLQRNTMMNGVNLGLLANSPPAPQLPVVVETPAGIEIYVDQADQNYTTHRVGIRSHTSGSLYFDRVETYTNTNKLIVSGLIPGETYSLSLMNVDDDGIESLFTDEFTEMATGLPEQLRDKGVHLLSNRPNPARDYTTLVISSDRKIPNTQVVLRDMLGNTVLEQAIGLQQGPNYIRLDLQGISGGTYLYTVKSGDRVAGTKQLLIQP